MSRFQDYSQNIHGKEIDLLRVTVKVPGKRPPKAVAPAGPSPAPPGSAPGVNGLSKELPASDGTSAGTAGVPQRLRAGDLYADLVMTDGLLSLPVSCQGLRCVRPASR